MMIRHDKSRIMTVHHDESPRGILKGFLSELWPSFLPWVPPVDATLLLMAPMALSKMITSTWELQQPRHRHPNQLNTHPQVQGVQTSELPAPGISEETVEIHGECNTPLRESLHDPLRIMLSLQEAGVMAAADERHRVNTITRC